MAFSVNTQTSVYLFIMGKKKVDLNPPQKLTLESKSSHANEVNKKFLKDEIQNGQ